MGHWGRMRMWLLAIAVAIFGTGVLSHITDGDHRHRRDPGTRGRIGGVLAMGCTIGQGLSGISTLALASILTLLSIPAGSALTMKWQ